ncbi:MAG: NAD(+)/NADH kinase, partial [Pirellulales bacterium]
AGRGSQDVIDVGIGTLKPFHGGGTSVLDSDDPLANDSPVFTFAGDQLPTDTPETEVTESFIDTTAGPDGRTVSGDYTYAYEVLVDTNAKTIAVTVTINSTFSYVETTVYNETNDGRSSQRTVMMEVNGNYVFVYTATATYTDDGSVIDISGTQKIQEDVSHDYLRTETVVYSYASPGEIVTGTRFDSTSGNYVYSYFEGNWQPGDAEATFDSAGTSQPFRLTETRILESTSRDSGIRTRNRPGEVSTQTYSESSNSHYSETVSAYGIMAYAGNIYTVSGTDNFNAAGTLSTNSFETTTYRSSYDTGSTQGTVTESDSTFYTATLVLATTYASTATYDPDTPASMLLSVSTIINTGVYYTDTFRASLSDGGSGTFASGVTQGDSTYESNGTFRYTLTVSMNSGFLATGSYYEMRSWDAPNLTNRNTVLSISTVLNNDVVTDSTSRDTWSYDNRKIDSTDSDYGSGSSSDGFHASASLNQTATTTSTNDQFVRTGNATVRFDAIGNGSVGTTGTSRRTKAGSLTTNNYSNNQSGDTTVLGSQQYNYTSTNMGDSANGTLDSTVNSTSTGASQSYGTITDSSSMSTFRDNQATRYTMDLTDNGTFSIANTSATFLGDATRDETTDERATSYTTKITVSASGETTTATNLTKSTSRVTASESTRYNDYNGSRTSRGSFSTTRDRTSDSETTSTSNSETTSNGTTTTKNHAATNDDGYRSSFVVSGTFREDASGRTIRGESTDDENRWGATWSKGTTKITIDADNHSFSSLEQDGSSRSTSNTALSFEEIGGKRTGSGSMNTTNDTRAATDSYAMSLVTEVIVDGPTTRRFSAGQTLGTNAVGHTYDGTVTLTADGRTDSGSFDSSSSEWGTTTSFVDKTVDQQTGTAYDRTHTVTNGVATDRETERARGTSTARNGAVTQSATVDKTEDRTSRTKTRKTKKTGASDADFWNWRRETSTRTDTATSHYEDHGGYDSKPEGRTERDGTFLRAARAVVAVDIPIIGINSGKIGFLSKAEHDDLEDVLEMLREGDYDFEPRMVLEATVIDGAGVRPPQAYTALNEAAVVRGARARVVHAEVKVGDSHVATYICDGIVVASPTGSTGYSFSAGGPVLDPTTRNLVVTPIAAYLSALRSSVVGPQHIVR